MAMGRKSKLMESSVEKNDKNFIDKHKYFWNFKSRGLGMYFPAKSDYV
jgi:hypothetical protein